MQVIAATNRADILDPALMRSGRLDRKVEFPHPNEDARAKILQIHSRKMNVGCALRCWAASSCIPARPCVSAVFVIMLRRRFDQTQAVSSQAQCSRAKGPEPLTVQCSNAFAVAAAACAGRT